MWSSKMLSMSSAMMLILFTQRISPIFSLLQIVSSLANSSLRFQIVSASFAMSTFEYYNFKLNFKQWIFPLQTFHQVPLKKPQRLHENFVNSNLAKDFLVESHHLMNHASPEKFKKMSPGLMCVIDYICVLSNPTKIVTCK